jgi:hypothetical protein
MNKLFSIIALLLINGCIYGQSNNLEFYVQGTLNARQTPGQIKHIQLTDIYYSNVKINVNSDFISNSSGNLSFGFQFNKLGLDFLFHPVRYQTAEFGHEINGADLDFIYYDGNVNRYDRLYGYAFIPSFLLYIIKKDRYELFVKTGVGFESFTYTENIPQYYHDSTEGSEILYSFKRKIKTAFPVFGLGSKLTLTPIISGIFMTEYYTMKKKDVNFPEYYNERILARSHRNNIFLSQLKFQLGIRFSISLR